MVGRLFSLIATGLFCLCPSPAFCDGIALQKAWEDLFAQPNPAAAKTQITAVLAACDNDVETLRRQIASDTAYAAQKPGWRRLGAKVVDGGKTYDMEFFVRVPKGYTAERSYPLLVAAHGQKGNGRHIGRMMELLLGAEREKYVIVAPTMPGPDRISTRAYQEQTYLLPLYWTRLHLNIDDDRIYISGYSQGGHLSWHMATMFPRLFAGAVPMAGIPCFEGAQVTCDMYLENLSNLPLWAIWGEKDTAPPPALGNVDICRLAAKRLKELDNKKFQGTELPGKGHGGCVPDPAEFVRFLSQYRRIVVPEKFEHLFHLSHHARGYYLHATELGRTPIDFSKGIKVQVPGIRPRSKEEIRRVMRKHVQRYLFEMRADLDRSENLLTIRAKGIRIIRLYVMEGMFDLSKEQGIRYWSRKWKGRIPPSAACMLRHYATTRDRTALVLNEIDLDIRGKASIRYKRPGGVTDAGSPGRSR